ncbi:CDP-alcohol phosphatidyltransferase family protein [Demequina mangrovi]|uniref:CDP-diacylglycerol-phosphatidylglycerol phosphatidyltransferase n=1 Tax=Demequina mangrovi TaxID=1043493 RepID=A0A1H6U2G4_9MICO|nr:CDP-alcohol phosphatidyltransferase family protein [Demequina mangrovi]SEI84684.1 CDP-diacylglycerol-phosphatidylglycerol phosphatidyltransferase [Demequina mangrovi]
MEAIEHPQSGHVHPVPATAVWTIPNAISAVRLVLIVVFGTLLAAERDAWAIVALAAAGITDFLDGFLARRWGQVTRLGRLLDPAADRLLTAAVVLGLAFRDVIPWWLVAVLLARDVMVGVGLLIAHHHHVESPQVTFVGKVATAMLYLFLPLAYLAVVAFPSWGIVSAIAVAGASAASVLYWYSGIGYIRDLRARTPRRDAPQDVRPDDVTGLG